MSKAQIPYEQAKDAAELLAANLGPYCHRVEIVGSLRRLASMPDLDRPADAAVGDIEVLAIPVFQNQEDLFGESVATENLLWARVEAIYEPWPDPKAWGEKQKRIALPLAHADLDAQEVPAEIWTASYATWPIMLMIRTGDADFSKAMVTGTDKGGLLSPACYVEGGRLHRAGRPVELFSESQLFREWELPWVPPYKRTGRAVKWLRKYALGVGEVPA